jgi:hypothetical protein
VKPFVYFCLAILVCIFAWHIFLWSQAPKIADIEVNPLTDVVYVYVPDVTAESGLGNAFVASFKGARDLVGGAIGGCASSARNSKIELFAYYQAF